MEQKNFECYKSQQPYSSCFKRAFGHISIDMKDIIDSEGHELVWKRIDFRWHIHEHILDLTVKYISKQPTWCLLPSGLDFRTICDHSVRI